MTMAKSLPFALVSLLFCSLDASRLIASQADETPLGGSQMIQIKANAGEYIKGEATWQTVVSDSKKSCTGKILTWNAKVDSEDACKKACEFWGTEHVNANSDRQCGAVYFFHKADGTPFCRLYETCVTCKNQAFIGSTFTRSEEICSATCAKSDCRWKDGFKPKVDFASITCAAPDCSHDECCDVLHEQDTTPAPATIEYTDRPFHCPDGYIRLENKHLCSLGLEIDGVWHDHDPSWDGCGDWYPEYGCATYNKHTFWSDCPDQYLPNSFMEHVCLPAPDEQDTTSTTTPAPSTTPAPATIEYTSDPFHCPDGYNRLENKDLCSLGLEIDGVWHDHDPSYDGCGDWYPEYGCATYNKHTFWSDCPDQYLPNSFMEHVCYPALDGN